MTYLFDIGNVLLSFDFAPMLQHITGSKPDPQAVDKILAQKDAFEAGELTVSDYLEYVYPLLDFQGSDEEFFAAWNSIFKPIEANWKLVESLAHQGHRLILFSNINPIHAPYCLENYSVFQYFEHAAFSYQLGAIKPSPTFFNRAFEQFQITPQESIYIDDLPANIAMGEQLGLQSFCYDHRQHEQLTKWLNQLNHESP